MRAPAGRLDRRIIIERRQEADETRGGGRQGRWVEVTTCWARVEPLRSFAANVERSEGGAISSMPPVRIHIRRSSQVSKVGDGSAAWRVKDARNADVIYNVKSVQNLDERGRFLTLNAVQSQPG